MTTIIFDRSRVTFVTPRGRVETDVRQAQRIASASGNQHELEEAIQNPDVPIPVIATTRARGLRGQRYSAVMQ